jgi:deferrochelatase/peroxidase EfeB
VDPQTTAVDPHRIMRAGIPFGPEVSVAEAANGKTTTDRGLMFVCYQTSNPESVRIRADQVGEQFAFHFASDSHAEEISPGRNADYSRV